ncbi:hypothetical protein [Streptomyces violascens]|uniref:hypothetical protein n=1 Tax=Streptomyces violascens TaxID=67381 RepID=UPI001679B878|nr:hypothetical protein [Streptomyces violascens]
MNDLPHDPLTVLQVSAEHGISEKEAETAMTWAAQILVHAWDTYADFWGLDSEDGAAMEKWGAQLGTADRRAVLETAVAAVKSADGVLADVYKKRDAGRTEIRPARVMRTNHPRLHIH